VTPEGEATNRAIQLAHVAGCKVYVAHVSCRESIEPIELAREKGWDVWGETCTQYFFIDRMQDLTPPASKVLHRMQTCSPGRTVTPMKDAPHGQASEHGTPQDTYRDWLVRAHHMASRDFDKALMTLSGGALGISLIFVRDYAPHPAHKWTLAISWASLGVSLLVILVSFLASQEEIHRLIREMDEGKQAPRPHKWVTRALNYVAGIGFVMGVGFLFSFALLNL